MHSISQQNANPFVEAGVQPECKDGIPLDPTVQLAMEWLHGPKQMQSNPTTNYVDPGFTNPCL